MATKIWLWCMVTPIINWVIQSNHIIILLWIVTRGVLIFHAYCRLVASLLKADGSVKSGRTKRCLHFFPFNMKKAIFSRKVDIPLSPLLLLPDSTHLSFALGFDPVSKDDKQPPSCKSEESATVNINYANLNL